MERSRPRAEETLPSPIDAFVRATNSGDLEALLATFVDDALVNDQLRDYWGRSEIRGWAERDIVGGRLRMEAVGCIEHYGDPIVTAHVDGAFDKRGLPDPLVLVFHFSARRDRIVRLIILRNLAGVE